MKRRDNIKFALFLGLIHIVSSILLSVGLCMNCGRTLTRLYSGVVYVPLWQSALFGIGFALLTCICFFIMVYIAGSSRELQKPRPSEIFAVFCANSIVLSLLYLICFAASFISFYLGIFIFLLSLFFFNIICPIGIEALTDAMVFGKQAFKTSCTVSATLVCLFIVFFAFLYLTYQSFSIDGVPISDIFYIIIRNLK
jgi:hypothetical protein